MIDNIKDTQEQLNKALEIIDWYDYNYYYLKGIFNDEEFANISKEYKKPYIEGKTVWELLWPYPNTIIAFLMHVLSIHNYKHSQSKEWFSENIKKMIKDLDAICDAEDKEINQILIPRESLSFYSQWESTLHDKKNNTYNILHSILEKKTYTQEHHKELLQVLDFIIDDRLLIKEWYN